MISKSHKFDIYWHTTPDTDFDLSTPNEETITVKNVIIKYREPPESRVPKKHWMLYLHTGVTSYTTVNIHIESAYLVGRDARGYVDMVVDHPSCSRRHAVLQHRLVPFQRPDLTMGESLLLFEFERRLIKLVCR